jgi:hypothetical protein
VRGGGRPPAWLAAPGGFLGSFPGEAIK